jgi:hypothetical protein
VRKRVFFLFFLFLFLYPLPGAESGDAGGTMTIDLYQDGVQMPAEMTHVKLHRIQPTGAHEQSDGTTIFEGKAFVEIHVSLIEDTIDTYYPAAFGSGPIQPITDQIEEDTSSDGIPYLTLDYMAYPEGFGRKNETWSVTYHSLEMDPSPGYSQSPVYVDLNYAMTFDYPYEAVEVQDLENIPIQLQITDYNYETKTDYQFISVLNPQEEEYTGTDGEIDEEDEEDVAALIREYEARGEFGLLLGSEEETIGGKTFHVGSEGIGRETLTQGEIEIPTGDCLVAEGTQFPADFFFYYQNTPTINKLIREFRVGHLKIEENSYGGFNAGPSEVISVPQGIGIEMLVKEPQLVFEAEYDLYATTKIQTERSGESILEEFWHQVELFGIEGAEETTSGDEGQSFTTWAYIVAIGIAFFCLMSGVRGLEKQQQ